MGGVVKKIFGGAAKVTNKLFGIDPDAQKDAIERAAREQAEATRAAAEKQAAAAKEAADRASTQARQQAESQNLAMQQSLAQQQLAQQIRDQTKAPEQAQVDLTGTEPTTEEEAARKRNPRTAYQGSGGSSTGIRLS